MEVFKFAGLLMFFSGLVVFSWKRKHLLLMLLALEFIGLFVYFLLFLHLSVLGNEYFFSMVFLSFSVCEGMLGLCVMVSLIRTHGNDYFQSFSVLW